MRPVTYTDKRGYKRRVLIRDEDPDSMAKLGIPAGPPDIEDLDWEGLKRDIHNALLDAGAFTLDDVRVSSLGLQPAITVLKRHLMTLYKIAYEDSKNSDIK